MALCSVTLKIITKVLTNRLKPLLPNLISPQQSTFVHKRLITDNIVLAHEVFHKLNRNTKLKQWTVGIKIDIEKAYDRLDWNFIRESLINLDLPNGFIANIMNCVTTVKFDIHINGNPVGNITPTRGIRHEDPLSPYLFIICMDIYPTLLQQAQRNKQIICIKIEKITPIITHLLFADDSILFCQATSNEATNLRKIFTEYQRSYGQQIDYNKSEMQFINKTKKEEIQIFKDIISIHTFRTINKYLGLPTQRNKSRNQSLNYIIERVREKLKA